MGVDNGTQRTASLRLRKINLTAPAALTGMFVQGAIIDENAALMNLCGEGGSGELNWLLQFDTVTKEVAIGAAPPTDNPFTTGYCFANAAIEGMSVGKVVVATVMNSDGSFTSDTMTRVNLPIFLAGGSMGAAVVLPLSHARLDHVMLSEHNDCIGHYNANAVVAMGDLCVDNSSSCARWTTGGALGGYVTLADADQVALPQLRESLCVLLTGGSATDTTDPAETVCEKDARGGIVAQGDFCSQTLAAGGCRDSFWVAATFAASAAKVVPANQPYCMGGEGG